MRASKVAASWVQSLLQWQARAEIMYENYNTSLSIEALSEPCSQRSHSHTPSAGAPLKAETMIQMMETGMIPACAKDLAKYKATSCPPCDTHSASSSGSHMRRIALLVGELGSLFEPNAPTCTARGRPQAGWCA